MEYGLWPRVLFYIRFEKDQARVRYLTNVSLGMYVSSTHVRRTCARTAEYSLHPPLHIVFRRFLQERSSEKYTRYTVVS